MHRCTAYDLDETLADDGDRHIQQNHRSIQQPHEKKHGAKHSVRFDHGIVIEITERAAEQRGYRGAQGTGDKRENAEGLTDCMCESGVRSRTNLYSSLSMPRINT